MSRPISEIKEELKRQLSQLFDLRSLERCAIEDASRAQTRVNRLEMELGQAKKEAGEQ